MASLQFAKAVKRDAKLRLALCGPAGSGKTYSALSIATELAGPNGRIAYVDTEHGSASKYADQFHFDVCEPDTYDPRQLVEMIQGAAKAGYKVFIVDSLSHYWMGTGGELDLVDQAAKRIRDNSFAAWKTVTPFHNALVDTLISANLHVICCLRTKTEWVIEKGDNGKSVPRKIGLAPVMRDGIEFEFDVCGDLDQDNNLTVTKSRCPTLSGKVVSRPGKAMADTLKGWLSGAPVEPARVTTSQSDQQQPTGEQPKPPAAAAPVQDPQGAQAASPIDIALVEFTKAEKFKRLEAFQALKKRLIAALGDQGEISYYSILQKHGVEKSDQFKTLGAARNAYGELFVAAEAADAVAAQPAEPEQSDAAEPPDDRESWVPEIIGSQNGVENA